MDDLKNLIVYSIDKENSEIYFLNTNSKLIKLYSYHDQDCCENHYLSLNDLELSDFDGLVFDLSNDGFFKRIEGYGIELIPTNGFPIRIPGYGSNNGCYSSNLLLVITGQYSWLKHYDIEECQHIDWV